MAGGGSGSGGIQRRCRGQRSGGGERGGGEAEVGGESAVGGRQRQWVGKQSRL